MMSCRMGDVAALYVDTARGPYTRLPGVDCWGYATRNGRQLDAFALTRDARDYDGPHPVVAHPPCGPWGRFWWNYKGGEGAKDCGRRAVEQVRNHGGVLEHPSASHLWEVCGMPIPAEGHDVAGGYTLEVDQCDWGHPARKRTWLYIVGVEPEDIPPLPPPGEPTHVMVRLLRNRNDMPEVPKRLRHLTPPRFARWLVELARRCRDLH
jgi:hypothetical protein